MESQNITSYKAAHAKPLESTMSTTTYHRVQVHGTGVFYAGHQPNTWELGLELAGIKVTKEGYVQVNEKLETTAMGVLAAGDVAGSTLQ